jgi:hypothetical protein
VHPSLFFLPGALLSGPELSAARIDGLLIEVGEGYMPPDLPEDAAARARSLTPLLEPGYALSGPSAAWVHGVGDAPPICHHLQRITPHRPRVERAARVVLHERAIAAIDVELIGGVPVTTLLRTLTDLVLAAGDDPRTAEWMRRLAAAASDLVPTVRQAIESRTRMPGKRAALARIVELERYEDVTR